MSSTLLSCGLLVINEQGELLVGHSTGSTHWDLPKGLIDPGETPIACALREAREEFGLVFGPERLVDLGRHAYYRGKDLHLCGAHRFRGHAAGGVRVRELLR